MADADARRATREHHTSRAKRRLLLHHHGLLLLLLLLRCRLRDGRRSVTLRLLRRIARLALLGLVTHPFILFSILFGDFSACVGRGLHHVVIYDGLASVHGWQRGTFVLLYAMRMQRESSAAARLLPLETAAAEAKATLAC